MTREKMRELILLIYFITLEIFYNINNDYNTSIIVWQANGPPTFVEGVGMMILGKNG